MINAPHMSWVKHKCMGQLWISTGLMLQLSGPTFHFRTLYSRSFLLHRVIGAGAGMWLEYCAVNGLNFSIVLVFGGSRLRDKRVGTLMAAYISCQFNVLFVFRLENEQRVHSADSHFTDRLREAYLSVTGIAKNIRKTKSPQRSCLPEKAQSVNGLEIRLILPISATNTIIICKINSLPRLLHK